MGKVKNDLKTKTSNCCEPYDCYDGCKYYDKKNNRCIVKFLRNLETYELYKLIEGKIKPKD